MSFYDDASLMLLASGGAQKDGKVYSVKPTDGAGDFTFTRGSNLSATRVDASQLIEKGRENVLIYSNDFNSTWGLANVSVTSGQIGYDGLNDAWLLEKSSNDGRVYQNKSQSGVQTFSVYAKKATSDYIRIFIDGISANVFFNLIDGSLYSANNTAATSYSVDIGNGWWRIVVIVEGSGVRYRIYPAEAGSTSATSGSIYIQDAQLEQGLVATPYIETGATTAQAGILENTPRFDYSGGATCPSLLLEPSRTNLFTQSEYFGGSSWTKVGSTTITNNYTTSPSGQNNATRLQWTNATNYIYQPVSHIGSNHTLSIYLKSNTGVSQNVRLFMDNGAKGKEVVVTTQWQRFEFTILQNTQSDRNAGLIKSSSQVGDLDISIFAAQFEQNASYPTSYIPTYGVSQTRAVDDLKKIGIGDLIGDTQGTLFLDLEKTNNDTASLAGFFRVHL